MPISRTGHPPPCSLGAENPVPQEHSSGCKGAGQDLRMGTCQDPLLSSAVGAAMEVGAAPTLVNPRTPRTFPWHILMLAEVPMGSVAWSVR